MDKQQKIKKLSAKYGQTFSEEVGIRLMLSPFLGAGIAAII